MNKKSYIDKIELILNTSGKYITRKEKDMILDYVNYFKTKNNVIEDKNIELVIEIERLNNVLKEAIEYVIWQKENPTYDNIWREYEANKLLDILKQKRD